MNRDNRQAAVRGTDRCFGPLQCRCSSPRLQGATERTAATFYEQKELKHVRSSSSSSENMAIPVSVARLCRLAGRTAFSLSVRPRRAVSLPARTCFISTSTASSEFTF